MPTLDRQLHRGLEPLRRLDLGFLRRLLRPGVLLLSGPEPVRPPPGASQPPKQALRLRALLEQTWPTPSVFLVDAVAEEQLNVAVPELEIPDESRRVPVPRRKDGHLEEFARLHRGLVDSFPRQDRYGGSGENPV